MLDPSEPVAGVEVRERLPLIRVRERTLPELRRVEVTHLPFKDVERRAVRVGGLGVLAGGGERRALLEQRLRLVLALRQHLHGGGELLARHGARDVLDLRVEAERLWRHERERGEALRLDERGGDELVGGLGRVVHPLLLVVDRQDELRAHGAAERVALERLADVLAADAPVAADLEDEDPLVGAGRLGEDVARRERGRRQERHREGYGRRRPHQNAMRSASAFSLSMSPFSPAKENGFPA